MVFRGPPTERRRPAVTPVESDPFSGRAGRGLDRALVGKMAWAAGFLGTWAGKRPSGWRQEGPGRGQATSARGPPGSAGVRAVALVRSRPGGALLFGHRYALAPATPDETGVDG